MGPMQRQQDPDEATAATIPQTSSSSFHFVSESQQPPRAPTHVSPFSFVHQASQETDRLREAGRNLSALPPTVEDAFGSASLSVPLGLSPGMNAFYPQQQSKRQKTRRSNLIGCITLETQNVSAVLKEDLGRDLKSHISEDRRALLQNVDVAENVEGRETRCVVLSEQKDADEPIVSKHSRAGGSTVEEHVSYLDNRGERFPLPPPPVSPIMELHKNKARNAESPSSSREGGLMHPGRRMDGEYPAQEISALVSASLVENLEPVPVSVSLWKLVERFRTQLSVLQDQQAELFEEETQRAQPNLNCGVGETHLGRRMIHWHQKTRQGLPTEKQSAQLHRQPGLLRVEQLESIMKDIERYRAQQDACISQENFIEAERLDEIIHELEHKLFGRDNWDTQSPFDSFLQLQEGLLNIATQWRQNIDFTTTALKDTRGIIITDACNNVDFEVKRLAGDVERLKFETARLNLESEQLEAQSATIAVEWDQLQDYMTQQTQEDVALRNEVVKQKDIVDAEIEAMRKALETKLKDQAALEEQIHSYDIKIGAARSKFQKQLKRLETSRTALAVARSEVEAERQQLHTVYIGVAENKAALERNLYKTIVDIGGVWLAILESEKGLLVPARQLEDLHRRAVCVTETITLGDREQGEENSGRATQEVELSLTSKQEERLVHTSKAAFPINSCRAEGTTEASTAHNAQGLESKETADSGKDVPPVGSCVEPDSTTTDGLYENIDFSKASIPPSSPRLSPRSSSSCCPASPPVTLSSASASEACPPPPPPPPPLPGHLLLVGSEQHRSSEVCGKEQPSSPPSRGSSLHTLLRRLGETRTHLEELAKGIRLNRQEKTQIAQRLEECRAQKTSVVAMRLFREAATLMREIKALEETVETLDSRFAELQTELADAGEIQRELENALAESRAADRDRRRLEVKRAFDWMQRYILELQWLKKQLPVNTPFLLFGKEAAADPLKSSEGLSESCGVQQVLEEQQEDQHQRSIRSDFQWEGLGYWVDGSLAKNSSSCLTGNEDNITDIPETTQREYVRLLESHFIVQAVRSAAQESCKSWETAIAQEIDICSQYCVEWSREYDITFKESESEEVGSSEDPKEFSTSTAAAEFGSSGAPECLDASSSFSLMTFLEPAMRALRHVNSVLALFSTSKNANVESSFPAVSTDGALEHPLPSKATDNASPVATTAPMIKDGPSSPLREATGSVVDSPQSKRECQVSRLGTEPADVSLGDEAETGVSGSGTVDPGEACETAVDIPPFEGVASENQNPVPVVTENSIHRNAEILQRIKDLEEKLEEAVESNDFDTASLLDDKLTYLKATHFPDLHVN